MSERILEIQLEEWRRKYDSIDTAYDRIRARSITLITVQLAFGGYILTQIQSMIHNELYGIVFFIMGVLVFLYSASLSTRNYRARHGWSSPMWELEIERMNNCTDTSAALEILVADYKKAYDHNLSIHEPAAQRLNQSLFIFIAAAIILLVLHLA